ncbi:hypothetical protein, conserved [Eimeria brunetti]|uniref:WLM domain-containing protein n=1 Tax=Eimeria brunetti TaxID=51314 RepID=U6M1X6_9EIME|nr:hypothetical protein, conserved [Eimeria brunetti]
MINSSGRKNNSSNSNRQKQQPVAATASCTPSSEPATPWLHARWKQQQEKSQKQHKEEKLAQERNQEHDKQADAHEDSFLTSVASGTPSRQPLSTAAAGPYGLPVAAAEYLTGVSSSGNGSRTHTVDLPPEVLAAAAKAMKGAPEEVCLARARLQEKKQLQQQQQQRLQRRLKDPQQQRRSVNSLAEAVTQPLQKAARKCRLDEGSYYTFKSAKASSWGVNGVTVELKNRGEVAASIHRLHCEYGVPLCREFGFRYFFLAEQHPLHRKAGSVIRKPLNNIERLDELQLQERSRSRSNTEPNGCLATAAGSSSSSSTKWSYCIRIRMRQLQRPQELLQLPTQLGIFFHELAHLRYMNHGLDFACLLARIFRFATERGLFEPGWETELPSPWLWERVLFYCGGFVTDSLLQQLLLADPKARAAAGTACNLDAQTSPPAAAEAATSADTAQVHSEEQAPDAPSPPAAAVDPSASQATTAAATSIDPAAAKPAPASGAPCAARVTRKLPKGIIKHEAVQGSIGTLRVQQRQQQPQQMQRQRRIPPTATLRQRSSRDSAIDKAAARTDSSSSSKSNGTSNGSTTGPQRVSRKFFVSACPAAPTLHQQRSQKLQQSQPQRRHQQQLLKHRSSINSNSSSTGSGSTGSNCRRSSSRQRGIRLS